MKILLVSFLSALAVVTAYGQTSVVRHPGDVLHYQVKFEGGDISKLNSASIYLHTENVPADQPGLSNGFNGGCTKGSAAGVFDCSATIPNNIGTGNYRLNSISVSTGQMSHGYAQDFHLPLVPIENPITFNPPTGVTVTPKP